MDTNNENQAMQNPVEVSPDQTSMFVENTSSGEDVTRMDIPHSDDTVAPHAGEPIYNLGAANAEAKDEEVPNSTKIKVIAALAIVGVAGYIAYWVQEPVQLKADLLSGYSATTPSGSTAVTNTTSTPVTPTSSTTVAATDTTSTPTGASKNVDVSLFGFEPAVMKIDKGTTVIWTNTSTEDQTLIGSSVDGQSFTSTVMTSGSTFSYKFDQDATFTYYSTYNPALKATLTVGTGGTTAAAAAATPDATATTNTTTTTGTTTAADTSAPAAATDTLFNSAATTDTTSVLGASTADTSLSAAATQTTTTTTTTPTTIPGTVDLKGAAPGRLAKTGPAEDIYVVALLGIAWFNRKKLVRVFKK